VTNKDLSKQFYSASPFPHLIIDNFLSINELKKVKKSLENFKKDNRSAVSLNNSTTKKKIIHKYSKSPKIINKIVDKISNDGFIKYISKICQLESKDLKSLKDFKMKYLPFRFFHEMDSGGYMGSHVDHSFIKNKVHFLNSILYLSDTNSKTYSGSTNFYSKNGLNIKKKIKAKKNRLVLFLHSSESFHGVSKIQSGSNKRYTIYMDYYISQNKLYKLQQSYNRYRNSEKIKFWKHQTTFLPNSFLEFNRYIIFFKYLVKKYLKRIY